MEKYNELTPAILEQFKTVVGDRCYVGDAISPDYAHDEMPIYGKYAPECVCEVETTEEVSKLLKICNENHIAVTTRGAGTSLTGGCVPICGGVVICTMRMNKIIGYDEANMAVTLQPGVLLQDLAADADAHGFFYPPDPGSKTSSVGGNVATNAGGMRAVKYGTTRDYVLEITVVLADGRVMKLGRTVCKASTGYSLLHLMIGAEGTLGIITEMTMKLVTKPAKDVSVILPFTDLDECVATVPKIKMSSLAPQSIELIDADIVRCYKEFSGNAVFPQEIEGQAVGASILVTLVGDTEDELDAKMEQLYDLAMENGAMDALVVDTPTLKKEVWKARSEFLTAIEQANKYLDELDVVVPISKISEFLKYVRAEGQAMGLVVSNFGHAGDGNMHIYGCTNELEFDEFWKRNEQFMEKCYAKCQEVGGLVSGEHGIGSAKKQYLEECVGEVAYDMMEGIKTLFDPNRILNPGKVLN